MTSPFDIRRTDAVSIVHQVIDSPSSIAGCFFAGEHVV